jgi:hypothetical protein
MPVVSKCIVKSDSMHCEHLLNILTFKTVIYLAWWICGAAKHAYVSVLFQFASLGWHTEIGPKTTAAQPWKAVEWFEGKFIHHNCVIFQCLHNDYVYRTVVGVLNIMIMCTELLLVYWTFWYASNLCTDRFIEYSLEKIIKVRFSGSRGGQMGQ